jgi:hypothetical protein
MTARVYEYTTCSYQGFIQVCVGQGQKQETFDVHESLIIARALFFRKELSEVRKKSEDHPIRLLEDEPTIFKLYVHLLYTGVAAILPDPVPEHYVEYDEHLALANLYVLAEKLQDTDAKYAVVEATMEASRLLRSDGKC